MSGLRLDCGSNIRGPTETINTGHQLLQQVFRAGAVTTWSPVPYRGQLATTKATSSSRKNPWNTGLAAYLVSSSISRPACHYQSNLLQPFESLEHGAGRLLGPCPHL